MIFPRVTPGNPCPICNRTDWCQFGDRAMKCMRVESQHACASGGWFHFYGDGYKPAPMRPEVARPSIDAERLMKQWADRTSTRQKQDEAFALGVKPESLIILGAAWAEEYKAWAYPMRDGDGNTVGIRLRNNRGFKWAVRGSRQGIFMPIATVGLMDVAYLPEGPTSTAALLSLGLYSIGRPSCNAGNDIVKSALKRLGIYLVVIVSDNDTLKDFGGKQARPGYEGARKLQRELGIKSTIWMPPSPLKDARDYLRKGGTKELIESDLRNRIWTKL